MVAINPKGSSALPETETPEEFLSVDDVPPEPNLPSHVASHLGEQLKAFYAHLVNEPVPDRFIRLLDQLDRDASETDGE